MSDAIYQDLAHALGVRQAQVTATVGLLDNGATVPFIARYRKEATGGLDDTQLRELEKGLAYRRELAERRDTIITTIREQGSLTDSLHQALLAAATKQRLEDLYQPYKKKRRTKGEMARQAGLEPLADALFEAPSNAPEALAAGYVDADAGVEDSQAALTGARYILAERWTEDAELLATLREWAWQQGRLVSEVDPAQREAGAKFSDYFDYSEAIARIPSHRALALLRGRREGVLRLRLTMPDELEDNPPRPSEGERKLRAHLGLRHQERPADEWLAETIRFTWRVKLLTRLETDLVGKLREAAEAEAIDVFGRNLRDLLLAAPAGQTPVIGVDPGLRTGCKVAVVAATGTLEATATIYPHAPQKRWDEAARSLAQLASDHGATLIAVGNGTASRETEQLAKTVSREVGGVQAVMVSEAGASVYSASETAAREFPELDVSLRGAVSIARRLQDPLAELVKIEPKSIGVGQYQHDVNQTQLARTLDAVVEDGVNAVGVDLNTASAALLARVAGLNQGLAERIVSYRDEHGGFRNRQAVKKVSRLGDKTFEQAAGFLRIRGGDTPLDASGVHPEAYPVVERIAADAGRSPTELIGDTTLLQGLDPGRYTDERFGVPTVTDILDELAKPGRDPRPAFRTADFREDVTSLSDLVPGMVLEGVVTNVTNFGAFVDIGVHQDGLVHISAMAEQFVRDPRSICKSGDIVRVRVVEVDERRQRIGLTMRLDDAGGTASDSSRSGKGKASGQPGKKDKPKAEDQPATAMAAAFRNSGKNKD
jgi:uncharacterized protein